MIILAWTTIQSCLKLYSVFYANASSCIELGFDFAVVLLITMVMERVVSGILLVMVRCIWDWKQKSQLFIPKKLVFSSCYAANDAALSTLGNIVQQYTSSKDRIYTRSKVKLRVKVSHNVTLDSDLPLWIPGQSMIYRDMIN